MSPVPPSPEQLTADQHRLIPIVAAMGTRVVEAGDGRAVIELPAGPNGNHFGALYAGSLYTVAELLGGTIPRSSLDLEGELAGFVPLLKSSQIRYLRPALGTVRASAALTPAELDRVRREALEHGKAEFVLEAAITDEAGTVVAESAGVYQLRRLPVAPASGSPQIGDA